MLRSGSNVGNTAHAKQGDPYWLLLSIHKPRKSISSTLVIKVRSCIWGYLTELSVKNNSSNYLTKRNEILINMPPGHLADIVQIWTAGQTVHRWKRLLWLSQHEGILPYWYLLSQRQGEERCFPQSTGNEEIGTKVRLACVSQFWLSRDHRDARNNQPVTTAI